MSKDKRVNSLKSGIQDSKKKYNGGKNIKLSKADRFAEPKQKYPGPGEYAIDSIFNRYKWRYWWWFSYNNYMQVLDWGLSTL